MKTAALWIASLAFLAALGAVFAINANDNIETFKRMFTKWPYFAWAIAVVGALYLIERKLYPKYHRVLSWSWPKTLGWKQNLNTFFLAIPALRLVGILLIFINLPLLVTIEELIFRNNTSGWPDAVLRSIAFGFAHFVIGVHVLGMIDTALIGLLLSEFYFRGGLEHAIYLHLAIDIVFIAPIIFILCFARFIPLRHRSMLRQLTLGDHGE